MLTLSFFFPWLTPAGLQQLGIELRAGLRLPEALTTRSANTSAKQGVLDVYSFNTPQQQFRHAKVTASSSHPPRLFLPHTWPLAAGTMSLATATFARVPQPLEKLTERSSTRSMTSRSIRSADGNSGSAVALEPLVGWLAFACMTASHEVLCDTGQKTRSASQAPDKITNRIASPTWPAIFAQLPQSTRFHSQL
ncbi:hypothetical protein B0T14DRAFT_37605 [Immersiella caudata]|uniref:Uncharacterized protein n=1 Tax=Immersiella caudata TaxID=314043 RepID=A0AA39XG97_9PEZI|nr:hypothetical protein B0T14DRAFT_37605 [Immersiella caudata]